MITITFTDTLPCQELRALAAELCSPHAGEWALEVLGVAPGADGNTDWIQVVATLQTEARARTVRATSMSARCALKSSVSTAYRAMQTELAITRAWQPDAAQMTRPERFRHDAGAPIAAAL